MCHKKAEQIWETNVRLDSRMCPWEWWLLCILRTKRRASFLCWCSRCDFKKTKTTHPLSQFSFFFCAQVFKFSPLGKFTKQLLVLGEKLIPGSDYHHFCQPADVAVEESGEFFVADGSVYFAWCLFHTLYRRQTKYSQLRVSYLIFLVFQLVQFVPVLVLVLVPVLV